MFCTLWQFCSPTHGLIQAPSNFLTHCLISLQDCGRAEARGERAASAAAAGPLSAARAGAASWTVRCSSCSAPFWLSPIRR